MAGDACGLSKRVQGVPLFEIYRKDLSLEPWQIREAFFDMAEELIAVGSYPIPVPPAFYLFAELAASLDVLSPLVMVSGSLGVVVVDHDPQDPVLHLSPVEESVYGFVFGLVELQYDLMK